jgi:hypothetical protein
MERRENFQLINAMAEASFLLASLYMLYNRQAEPKIKDAHAAQARGPVTNW